ncbi:MAG: hypothetical protein ACRENK_01350 [Gemmatimonadaceae bacterium]
MHFRPSSIYALALASISTFSSALPAQRVLGVGDDASVLPRGMFRLQVGGDWTSFNERYGSGTPGRANGSLEPLGIDFTLDTVGVKQFPSLNGLQSTVQQIIGDPNWFATLGNAQLNLRDRVNSIPLVLEAGLTSRISIAVQVPYVTTQTGAFFSFNTAGIEGNLGFNPALANTAAAAQNTAMFSQFTASADALDQDLRNCAANPGGAGCSQLNAQRATAQSLVDNSRSFAGGVNGIYATSAFVPIAGTDAQLAIEARVAAFKALYAQFAGLGVPQISASGPFASQNRLTALDAQTILSDTTFGFVAAPLATTGHSHFGDVDIGGKISVFDSFHGNTRARMSPHGLNFRTSIGGVYRFPTSQIESPDNFIDIGTGRGAKAVEGRWFSDLLIGSKFWQSFVLRVNKPFADDQEMRITDLPNEELAPRYRRQMVHRALGTTMEFETSPRLVVNNFFSISGQYVYSHKAEDHYTGTFTIPAAVTGFSDLTIDASTLGLETETREHRAGGGITYSNLYAVDQGTAQFPFEVTYLHWQTIKGSGGNQPKFFTDQIVLRLYTRIFGGR